MYYCLLVKLSSFPSINVHTSGVGVLSLMHKTSLQTVFIIKNLLYLNKIKTCFLSNMVKNCVASKTAPLH